MRTTVTIDDALLDQVRQRAAARRQTVSQVIEDSVRQALLSPEELPERDRFRVRAFDGGGVQPGVDLSDNAALLEAMDGR